MTTGYLEVFRGISPATATGSGRSRLGAEYEALYHQDRQQPVGPEPLKQDFTKPSAVQWPIRAVRTDR